MLKLSEHLLITEEVDRLVESEQTEFTDEQIDKAAFYNLKWNPVSAKTILALYGEDGLQLSSVEFDDADVAIEYIQDIFDLDEDELEELDSYSWANDGKALETYALED